MKNDSKTLTKVLSLQTNINFNTMANAVMTIRMDQEVKKSFEILCETLGMTVNTAINVFVREAVRNQKLNLSLAVQGDRGVWKMTREEARAKVDSWLIHGGNPVPPDEDGMEGRIREKFSV